MRYLTDKEYESRLKKIKLKNKDKERKRILKNEKEKYKRKLKLPSTSKLILIGVILLCLQIVIFCEYVMVALGDISAMYVLIGIPATLIPIVWGYYSKSKAENTAGGIVFEAAMRNNKDNNDNDNDEQDEYTQYENMNDNEDNENVG